jgi:uncharacterized integral membrane protein
MNIIRTLTWILITALLVAFMAMNWGKAPVNIWPSGDTFLHFDWPVGFIAFVFFLLGLVPMWLFHRAARWQLKRRIASLENTARTSAQIPLPAATAPEPVAQPAPAPAAEHPVPLARVDEHKPPHAT